MKKGVRIFSTIICVISFIALVVFLYYLEKLGVLPSKYLYLICGVLTFLELIFIISLMIKKTKSWILILFDIIAFLIIVVEIFASIKLKQANDFIEDDLIIKETKDIYYIMVNKDSKYTDLKSIENKFVDYFNDIDDFNKLKDNVSQKVNVILNEVSDYSSLLPSIEKDKEKIILVSDSNYDLYLSSLKEDEGDSTEPNDDETGTSSEHESNFRILDTIELTNVIEANTSTEDIMKKPFTIYLSGIDSRSGKLPSRSRSDVNIFIVVNPKTRDILLVSTPRDYYVQLHGIKGQKDKLTHAGYVGGVKLSKATLEDLLGYEANYYVRVNFDAVVRLVDALGGITVYSDVNYDITRAECTFKPGYNNLDGACALRFARERYAYKGGDRHRGKNQQQIIQRVIEKVSSSKTLVMHYDDILKAMKGTFETSLSTKNITSIVQFQLNDMRGWNITTANLDGPTGMTSTYTCPNCKRSVMYQNKKSIDAAKAKIKAVLEKE